MGLNRAGSASVSYASPSVGRGHRRPPAPFRPSDSSDDLCNAISGGHARNVNIMKGKVRFVEPMLALIAITKLRPGRAP
jgi:hypothetical protein